MGFISLTHETSLWSGASLKGQHVLNHGKPLTDYVGDLQTISNIEAPRNIYLYEFILEQKFKGHTLRVWFKNENLISWLDDKPYVTCPDLICIVDNDNCMGLGNMYELPSYREKKVTVFGFPAHELWKTDKGLKLWNPKNYGFNIEYKPLE